MRLLDADALREWLRKIPIHDLSDGKGLCRVIFADDLARTMRAFNGGSIEIVQCRECAKRGTGECPMEQDYPWISSDSDGFCNQGTRREDGNDGNQAR